MAAFLKPMKALGVTVVSRQRKDAALWAVPGDRDSAAGRASTASGASTWRSGPLFHRRADRAGTRDLIPSWRRGLNLARTPP